MTQGSAYVFVRDSSFVPLLFVCFSASHSNSQALANGLYCLGTCQSSPHSDCTGAETLTGSVLLVFLFRLFIGGGMLSVVLSIIVKFGGLCDFFFVSHHPHRDFARWFDGKAFGWIRGKKNLTVVCCFVLSFSVFSLSTSEKAKKQEPNRLCESLVGGNWRYLHCAGLC